MFAFYFNLFNFGWLVGHQVLYQVNLNVYIQSVKHSENKIILSNFLSENL